MLGANLGSPLYRDVSVMRFVSVLKKIDKMLVSRVGFLARLCRPTYVTLHEKSILREFTNIRKYSVNKWNCMHYPFAILFS